MLALPLVAALAARAQLTIAAPGWGVDLYGIHGRTVRPGEVPRDADAGILVKPAFRAAWEARGLRRRVGWPTDHRRFLLTDVVAEGCDHRLAQMARLGGPLDVDVSTLPALPTVAKDSADVLLVPLSASGPTVQWTGFRALADHLHHVGHRVVFVGGPGQSAALAAVAGPHPMLPELPISALAPYLAGAAAVVGNDSGLLHLAAAARRGADRAVEAVVVVYGSTSPDRTGPPGSTPVVGPRLACAPCYRKSCTRGLGCLSTDLASVLAAVRATLDRTP